MGFLSEPKDPDEIITVGFDYSGVTSVAPTSPAISIGVRWGSETVPSLAASGAPIIDGTMIYQRFTGGATMHDYNLKCLATVSTGDRFAVDCVLPVRTRPL
jgi:hypothetical protein